MQPTQIILLVIAIALMAGLIINRLTYFVNDFSKPETEPEPPRWYVPDETKLEFARRWDVFMNTKELNKSSRAAGIEFWNFANSIMPEEFTKRCHGYGWQEVIWDGNRPYIVAADRVKTP